MKPSPFHGFLNIDKPSGMTSRDVVDRAQGWFPRGTKLGHTGTLDPLATGVLVLAVGSGTRLTEYVQDMDKTYRAEVHLGCRSDTDDLGGPVEHFSFGGQAPPPRARVEACVQGFIGEIMQTPPPFSALKVNGRRAYDLARRGQDVVLEPRPVRIYGIDVLAYEYPQLTLDVHCGKGTYIRALARDIGQKLERGGLLAALRRTRIGGFKQDHALGLDVSVEAARAGLLPLAAAVAGLPRVVLTESEATRLRQGQVIRKPQSASLPTAAGEVGVFDEGGGLVAVGTWEPVEGLLAPIKVLPVESA